MKLTLASQAYQVEEVDIIIQTDSTRTEFYVRTL